MLSPKEYTEIINKTISEIQFPSWLPGLYNPIRYAMEGGGKRLRPTLLLAVNDAFNGNIEECLWPAVGIELFHNFTLVHDDVMDHADLRRGRPTVFKKWNLNTAILSGDTMVSLSYKCIASCPPMYLPEVLDRFGMMTINVYEGQQMDEEFEKRTDVSFAEYIKMVIGKTSALIASPCAIGALISGASPIDTELMYNFGISLGIAFQMQDDYLDVYGDPETFGKEIGGDILNDKKTWLYIMAKDADKDNSFEKILKSDISGKDKILAVTNLYNEKGIKRAGEKLIEQYTNDALEFLDKTSMSSDGKEWIKNYALALLGRKK